MPLNITLNVNSLELISLLESLLNTVNSKKRLFEKFRSHAQKGFYIFGNTGSGKTAIMNAFFEGISTTSKLNMHFHDYFLDISKLLMRYSMEEIVTKISSRIKVLCFDEFFIESIADARLLRDLFTGLIKNRVIIILTSNFEPEKLYENGFNRDVIFPDFSNFLRDKLNIFNLSHSFDFREKNSKGESVLISKIPDNIFNFKEEVLIFQNHRIHCKTDGKMAIFEYKELFIKPRSINEFIFVCRKFDKIYIANFCKFTSENEDELIRFRNFIDIAYIRNTVIFLQTTASLEEIFEHTLLSNIKIKRTYSRLLDMGSKAFLSNFNLKRKWHNDARDFFENL